MRFVVQSYGIYREFEKTRKRRAIKIPSKNCISFAALATRTNI